MKRLIFVLTIICAFTFNSVAQNLTAKTTGVYIAKGAATDTINKDGVSTYVAYIPNGCYAFKAQVTQTTVKGYAKTKTFVESSLDNVLWTKIDSVSVGSTAKGITAVKNPYAQYVRLRTVAIDSTQTTKLKYYLVIEKLQ